MEPEFETLPFAGEFGNESEMEDERGSRGRGSSRPVRGPTRQLTRPSRPQRKPGPPKRPPPAGKNFRRPPSGWGPWPYPVFPSLPYPAVRDYQPEPEPEPSPEPEPAPDRGFDSDGAADADTQGEAPIVTQAINDMVAARKIPKTAAPSYVRLGPISDQLLRHTSLQGPGLYLIEFSNLTGQHAYSGQGDPIRNRLRDHLLTIRRWGVDPRRYTVYVATNPAYAGPTRRQVEYSLHDTLFRLQRDYLTNRQRELEFDEIGF